jgi:hypothetical protein
MLVYEGNYCLPRAVPERMAAVAPSLGVGDFGQRGCVAVLFLRYLRLGMKRLRADKISGNFLR